MSKIQMVDAVSPRFWYDDKVWPATTFMIETASTMTRPLGEEME
jgi:hypothetical protein